MSVIDQIKNTIPITDVLEQYANADFTHAKTHRERFNICCPYHKDRSPSLTVYKNTNTFRCWAGCNDGKSGDSIDVVKLSLNTNTKEAIKIIISDYGLSTPDSKKAKEWHKKRAVQKQSVALAKALNKTVLERMDSLKRIEKMVRTSLSSIKTVEDLDRVGDLYHVLVQIEYWLDNLAEPNSIVQFQTIQEVSRFLKKMSVEER